MTNQEYREVEEKVVYFVGRFGQQWLNNRAEILADQLRKYENSPYQAIQKLIANLKLEQEIGKKILRTR
jgi:hypothetical protein